jgi:F-type H+-transporting ATPase subunit epsilon
MANPTTLRVVTPEREAFTDEVEMVILPGVDGELGVLHGHAPLVTALRTGEVRVTKDGIVQYLFIGDGFASVQPDGVTLLVDRAERAEEIDAARAQRALERAQARLARKGQEDDPRQAREAMERAIARIKVASHAGRG